MEGSRSLAGRLAALGVAAALALGAGTAWAAGVDTTFTSIPPANPGSVLLNAVSAKSATDAWAVGTQSLNQNTVIATVAEHWNGSRWQVTPTPNPTGNADLLSGVVNISPTNAWAVGSSRTASGGDLALVEHWNGTRWSQVPSAASTGFTDEVFNAVAATSASDVWAVGEHFDSSVGGSDGLIEHFNGTSWSILPAPATYTSNGIEHVVPAFNSVLALSPTDVWAATNSGVQAAVVEHWNGTAWTVVPTPDLTTVNNVAINGLAGSSSTDVWAVGGTTGFGRHAPHNQLVEHWNGTSWSVVPGPSSTSTPFALYSATALSANDVWAVGPLPGSLNAGFQHWDGASWTAIPVPAANFPILQLSSAAPATMIGIGYTQALLSTNS